MAYLLHSNDDKLQDRLAVQICVTDKRQIGNNYCTANIERFQTNAGTSLQQQASCAAATHNSGTTSHIASYIRIDKFGLMGGQCVRTPRASTRALWLCQLGCAEGSMALQHP